MEIKDLLRSKPVTDIETSAGRIYLYPLRVRDITDFGKLEPGDVVSQIRAFLPSIGSLAVESDEAPERVPLDAAIVAGLARFEGQPCMVIGHQKGRDTKERGRRNFGMPRPEGYRKALRLMHLAEKYRLPIFTFIDTPGAYPGIDAEERGQSEAIGRNLFEMAKLKTPIIAAAQH